VAAAARRGRKRGDGGTTGERRRPRAVRRRGRRFPGRRRHVGRV